ncbi:hypothetical protein VTN00DRAFT_160 [Thermoascus crustaceus]|uniref:uncharacterized protein n=1 Tax=Thermoascus crustaceus TaxID=5088 RepID=UPI0037420670
MTTPLQFSFVFNTQNFIQAGSLHIPCFYILSRPVRSLYSVTLQFPPACVLALSMQAQKGKNDNATCKDQIPLTPFSPTYPPIRISFFWSPRLPSLTLLCPEALSIFRSACPIRSSRESKMQGTCNWRGYPDLSNQSIFSRLVQSEV